MKKGVLTTVFAVMALGLSHSQTWFENNICNSGVASRDVPKDFHAGDSVHIRFRLFGFEARQIRQLYYRFAAVYKSFQAGTLRDK